MLWGMTTRLRRALTDSKKTAKALAEATGASYSATKNYVQGDRDPPASFIAKAAAFLGVSVEDLVEGDAALIVVLGPDESERAAALAASLQLPDMTPHEAQAFRSTLARWLKADEVEFPERLERMRLLAAYLDPPFGELGPRELTDYRVIQLAALAVAMPPRK